MRNFLFFISLLIISACWETTPPNATTPKTDTTTTPVKSPDPVSTRKTVTAPPTVAPQWLCIPGKQVGLIKNTSTEEDIIQAYGKENVVREMIGLGEGEMTEGTVVFPDSDNKIIIEWAVGRAFKKPAKIQISNSNAAWKTNQGIGVGTTLAELKAINGKDFKFAGFEWDYAGIANNWEGGNIDKHLTVFLEADNPAAIYPDLLGDGLFDSSHPKAAAAKLKVGTMVIELD